MAKKEKKIISVELEGISKATKETANLNNQLKKVEEKFEHINKNTQKLNSELTEINPPINNLDQHIDQGTISTIINAFKNKKDEKISTTGEETYNLEGYVPYSEVEPSDLQKNTNNIVSAFGPVIIGVSYAVVDGINEIDKLITKSIAKKNFEEKDANKLIEIISRRAAQIIDTLKGGSFGKFEAITNVKLYLEDTVNDILSDYTLDVLDNLAPALYNNGNTNIDIKILKDQIDEAKEQLKVQRKGAREKNKPMNIFGDPGDDYYNLYKMVDEQHKMLQQRTANNKDGQIPDNRILINDKSKQSIPITKDLPGKKPTVGERLKTDAPISYIDQTETKPTYYASLSGGRNNGNADEIAKYIEISQESLQEFITDFDAIIKNSQYVTTNQSDVFDELPEITKKQEEGNKLLEKLTTSNTLKLAPVKTPIIEKNNLHEAQPITTPPIITSSSLKPQESIDNDAKKENVEESKKIDQEYNKAYQEGQKENRTVTEEFQKTVKEASEERNEIAKDETDKLKEQKNERIGILSQIAKAYEDNTTGTKDAVSSVLKIFKGNNSVVDGLLNGVEKNLPKLLKLFEKTNQGINKEVQKSGDKRNKIIGEVMAESEKITKNSLQSISEHIQTVLDIIGAIYESVNADLDERITSSQEKIDIIKTKQDEMVEKVKESNNKINSLQEEAKTAQGGRLVVIQEQISREIETKQALANEEKRLAEEKKKAEEEKEKLEKKKKKNDLKVQLIQGIANIASGVLKAWSLGPILGPIMAAVVTAAGAIQIATISKQISKLADGGMLKGKTHAQGGMRIEGTNIEVEGGEYVINRASTRKNLGLVRYINSQRRELTPTDIDGYFRNGGGYSESPNFKTMFEQGGQLPADDVTNTYDNNPMLRAVETINLQPVVSVVDIANVQQNLTRVTDWTNTSSF